MDIVKNDYNRNVFQMRFKEIVGDKARQEEIAKRIGTSRQNIGNWLSGKAKPDIYSLAKIAKEYEISTDWILGLTDIKSPQTDIRLICRYTGLSEESVNSLHNFTDSGDGDMLYSSKENEILNAVLSNEKFYKIISSICFITLFSDNHYKAVEKMIPKIKEIIYGDIETKYKIVFLKIIVNMCGIKDSRFFSNEYNAVINDKSSSSDKDEKILKRIINNRFLKAVEDNCLQDMYYLNKDIDAFVKETIDDNSEENIFVNMLIGEFKHLHLDAIQDAKIDINDIEPEEFEEFKQYVVKKLEESLM